jgi:hypothetical protein
LWCWADASFSWTCNKIKVVIFLPLPLT